MWVVLLFLTLIINFLVWGFNFWVWGDNITNLSLHPVQAELAEGDEPLGVCVGQHTRLLGQVRAALPGHYLRHPAAQH